MFYLFKLYEKRSKYYILDSDIISNDFTLCKNGLIMLKSLSIAILIILSLGVQASTDTLLSDRMESLDEIVILKDNIQNDISDGNFDKVFYLYNSLKAEQETIKHFFPSVNTSKISKKMKDDQQSIIDNVYDVIKVNTGKVFPVNTNFIPKGLIVLGATPGMGILESRLDQAYKLAIKHTGIPIVLSGKGRKKGVVEADYMYDYLLNKGIKAGRMYKESYSLDTVGNAEFSYLTISENKDLKRVNDWLVVTNNFHSMRALLIFSRIFPNNDKIAVLLAPLLPEGVNNPEKDSILKTLITNEVKSDSNDQFMELLTYDKYNNDIYSFESKDITGQPCAILNEILLKHGLYKDKVSELTSKFSQCYM
jgi:uncharacterized SAM-binding protein YcdF (DUF218 family)